MSWKARLHYLENTDLRPLLERSHFQNPQNRHRSHVLTPTIIGKRKPSNSAKNRNESGSKIASKKPSRYWSNTTTMSGLPLSVRDKLEGKVIPKPPRDDELPTRLANYTFTYGLSNADKEEMLADYDQIDDLRSLPPMTPPSALDQVKGKAHLATNAIISQKLKKVKASLKKAASKDNKDGPVPFFTDWGIAPSSPPTLPSSNPTNEELRRDNTQDEESLIYDATRNILNQTGFHEGLETYFQGLQEMDLRRFERDREPFELTPEEVAEGIKAFKASSPALPRSGSTLRRVKPTANASNRSNLKVDQHQAPNTSRKSLVTLPGKKVLKKKPTVTISEPEPDPTVFIKPQPLKASQRNKIVEKQLQRELSQFPMSQAEFDKRKDILLTAASQIYEKESRPGLKVNGNTISAKTGLDEIQIPPPRDNMIELLFHALTSKSNILSPNNKSFVGLSNQQRSV